MNESVVSQTVSTAARTQELVYELKVEQVMDRHVITVTPENTLEDVRGLLREHGISGMPVMEGEGLVGVVSMQDVVQSLVEGRDKEPVKRWMSLNPVTLYADELLIHGVQKFDRYRYGRFPVIDRETRNLVGILTKGNLIRGLLRRLEADFEEQEIRRYRPSDWFSELDSDETSVGLRYFVQGSDFQRAGEASSKMKQNLRKLGIPPEAARRITIASYEAEMNMVIFTEGGQLITSIEPAKVTVTALDRGPGIPDVELAMKPGYSTAPDWVRELGFGAGMGLPNIKNCSDEMKLESKVGEGTNLQFAVFI